MTTINVQGSTGNTYKVIVKDDKYTCNCKSFFYRKRCKHIDSIRLKKNNAMNSKTNGSANRGSSEKSKIDFAKKNIEKARKRILSGAAGGRNPLIKFQHSDKKTTQARIVDELPNEIYKDLASGKSFVFRPLPEPDYNPKDENKKEFKKEFERAQKQDDVFLKKIEKMGDEYDRSNKESLKVIRELKDRIRKKLKMPQRVTPEIVGGLSEYAKKKGINPKFDLPKNTKQLSAKHADRNIQTILDPDLLSRKMKGIIKKSGDTRKEKGVDTLFLAIGFVQWYENSKSDVPVNSPLLLLPVELSRNQKTHGEEFRITGGTSDLQINIALKAKFADEFGMDLKDVGEDDTPESYFEKFESSIKKKNRWALKRWMTVGHFPFATMEMYHDLDPEKWENLGSQKNLKDIFSGSGESDGSVAEEYDVDDKNNRSKVPLLLNQADSSQLSTIIDVMDGKNVALQGPPGTGKSQTITNIIGAALDKGQKVLFLADKTAALDVVFKKLKDAGLEEFCLRIPYVSAKMKQKVIEDLKTRVALKEKKTNIRELKSEIKKEEETRNRLATYKRILTTKYGKSEKDLYEIYGLIINNKKYQKKIYSEIFEDKKNGFADKIYELSPDAVNTAVENLDKIEKQSKKLRSKYKNIKDHPWYGLSADRLSPYERKALVKDLGKLNDFFEKLSKEIKNLGKYKDIKELGEIKTLDDVKHFTKRFKNIDNIDKILDKLKNINSLKDIEKLDNFVSKTNSLLKKLKDQNSIGELFHLKKINSTKAKKIKKILENSGALSLLSSEFRNAKKEYLSMVKSHMYHKKTALENLEKFLLYKKNLPQFEKDKNEIEKDNKIKRLLKKDFKGVNTDLKSIENIKKSLALLKKEFSEKTVKEFLKNQTSLKNIIASAKKLSDVYEDVDDVYGNFKDHVDESFFDKGFYPSPIVEIMKKFKKLDVKLLDDWIEFLNAKKNNSRFENIILSYFDDRGLKYENLSGIFKSLYYNFLLEKIYKDNPELSEYSGEGKLAALQKEFKEIDDSIFVKKKEHLRKKLNSVNFTPGIGHGPTKNMTEFGLINQLINKPKSRVPLRSLVGKSSTALSDMKPCFMMSPTVLAGLVDQQPELFDLLIIDEASQMRSEDAIGGLARSKQCIIVGDPEQLAPSDFFRNLDGEDEDEDGELEQSVLDLALSRFKPKRMLKWHYRSKNPKLINFSNHHFYEKQLIIPPSPSLKDAISSNFVKSIYKGEINEEEKEALIDGLEEFMKHNIRKDENDKEAKSCLVVTMNKLQATHIHEAIGQRAVSSKTVEDYIASWANSLEAFEVKNLESVQGDERDCIFISTLFGPHEIGKKPRQNFGPINNKERGHRRLNVLFTRAKKEIQLYTSLHPNDITNLNSKGNTVFKNYLEYAKTGRLETGDISEDKEPMSEFEIWVKEGLEKRGYEVDPQVGVAGFYIDLGIKHKNFPDGYILGVECDGRAYHSSKSQRDNDILRQSILEDKGWNIYRIWSTDWFHDPQKELNKLDRYIKKII